ncbi:MAG: formylglycine-generating enzyme family protein [Litorimonas sp.]
MRSKYKLLRALLCLSVLSGCGAQNPKTDGQAILDGPNVDACLLIENTVVSIPGGTAKIGSDSGYPEERPEREVAIGAFDIDATEVTNAQFAAFVLDTGYVTSAEKPQPDFNVSGAAVFVPPDADNPSWWRFVEGANWRHPEGPDSSIKGRENDPVVQVSHSDAKAYAEWVGRALPSEDQWEYAAKAGSDTRYIWGESRAPDGVEQANTWQGAFPIQNTNEDGYLRRSPVGCYPPNDFGLYDMVGNVWEWTDTVFKKNETEPLYILKGGSFLCAENFCRRYRAAAKQPQEAGFPTNHIGFRTVSKRL